MLLGKRPRPPIKRTTSMTGITLNVDSSEPSDHHLHHQNVNPPAAVAPEAPAAVAAAATHPHDQRFLTAMVSPRNYNYQQQWRSSSSSVGGGGCFSNDEFMEMAQFLKTCGLCKRRLAPGRDIYMYRGDTAFCSLECREQQMKQDERKEKFAASAPSKNSTNNNHNNNNNAAAAASSKKNGTVAAA